MITWQTIVLHLVVSMPSVGRASVADHTDILTWNSNQVVTHVYSPTTSCEQGVCAHALLLMAQVLCHAETFSNGRPLLVAIRMARLLRAVPELVIIMKGLGFAVTSLPLVRFR